MLTALYESDAVRRAGQVMASVRPCSVSAAAAHFLDGFRVTSSRRYCNSRFCCHGRPFHGRLKRTGARRTKADGRTQDDSERGGYVTP